MNKHSKAKPSRRHLGTAILVVIALISILSYGGCLVYTDRTIAPEVTLWVAAAIMALITGSMMWRFWHKITGISNKIVNYAIHTAAFTSILLLLFLMANYHFADSDMSQRQPASVERVYTKTRHHLKRVTRKSYTRGEAYQVYYMEIKLPDGRLKSIPISKKQYKNTHQGDTYTVDMAHGLFGLDILRL